MLSLPVFLRGSGEREEKRMRCISSSSKYSSTSLSTGSRSLRERGGEITGNETWMGLQKTGEDRKVIFLTMISQ